MPISRTDVERHLADFVATMRRWQLDSAEGGLPCPGARIPLQWTEFFALPVAVDACRRRPDAEHQALVTGLVDFLHGVQRADGTFDAGFCGDLCQPCNAAFALRPLSRALRDWPEGLAGGHAERLEGVLRRAAQACVDGGMNTANHRWVAAAGLAHAARVLESAELREASDAWTRAGIDVDDDGAFSEGSAKYALVSVDCLLDLEVLQGRTDLGAIARASRDYLRAMSLPDGDLATVGSTRYDTEGSTDVFARAADVFERLGDADLAARALVRLWRARSAPGLFAACAIPPLDAHPKAKLYPSVVSALAAEHLLTWLRREREGPQCATDLPGESGIERVPDEIRVLRSSGLLRYASDRFSAVASRGPNLLQVQAGGAAIEGVRVAAHATGWNRLHTVDQRFGGGGTRLALSSAPGSEVVRLPQFHREAPRERRPGNAVPAITGEFRLRCGPGARVVLDLELGGVERANAMVELALRPDQTIFDGDGRRLEPPVAAPHAGRFVAAGDDAARLVLDHQGGSGHALRIAPYGYGDGDALWAPSFAPAVVRYGLALPARWRLEVALG